MDPASGVDRVSDVLLVEGRVARVGVVREDTDEWAATLQEDGGEEEREQGLRDTRSRRGRDELAQALALGELAGKGVKCRLVHDERRNREVPRESS